MNVNLLKDSCMQSCNGLYYIVRDFMCHLQC